MDLLVYYVLIQFPSKFLTPSINLNYYILNIYINICRNIQKGRIKRREKKSMGCEKTRNINNEEIVIINHHKGF